MKTRLLLIFIGSSLCVYAQKDSAYIKDLSHRVTFKVNINTDKLENNVEVFTENDKKQNFKIRPNEDYRFRLTASYRFLTLSYSFAPKFIQSNDDDEKGRTKSFNLGADFAFSKIFQKFSYNRTKGFHLENTRDFQLSTNPNKEYFKFSDVKIEEIKSQTYYYFNGWKHSMKLDNNQQELQRKSAGSFIIPFFLSYQKYTAQNYIPEITAIATLPNS